MNEDQKIQKIAGSALVIGKFYPFHLGHIHLIDTALKATGGSAYVLVMGSDFESISLATRVNWIKEHYKSKGINISVIGISDNAPVGYNSDELWAAHTEIIIQAATRVLNRSIAAIFTSEAYGDRLAEELGNFIGRTITHVCVDIDRKNVPISGTAVRSELDKNWKYLPNVVRRDLSVKVAIVGAESTGTSTLASSLRAHYSSQFSNIYPVHEYGREYTYDKFSDLKAVNDSFGLETKYEDVVWDADDFRKISERQGELQKIAELVSPLAIFDTDQLATSMWKDYYMKSMVLSTPDDARQVDIYLVTNDDIELVNDGWRDGDEEARHKMTKNFLRVLTNMGRPWVLISGTDHAKRLANAVLVVDELIKKKHTFYSPSWATVTKLD